MLHICHESPIEYDPAYEDLIHLGLHVVERPRPQSPCNNANAVVGIEHISCVSRDKRSQNE